MTTSITPYRETGIIPTSKADELFQICRRNFDKSNYNYQLDKIAVIYFNKLMRTAYGLSLKGRTGFIFKIKTYLKLKLYLIARKHNFKFDFIKKQFLEKLKTLFVNESFKYSINYFEETITVYWGKVNDNGNLCRE